MRTDGDGAFWDIAWDAVSFGMSVVDVICNPSDAWAWAGLAGDLIDVVVPFVSGVGEATDAIRIATKMDDVVDMVDDIHDAAKAIDNAGDMIGSYSDLRKIAKGTGNEVHHIVEQRFVRMHPELGDPLKMDSIILDKETHRIFTNRWRRELSYGSYYLKEQIITAGERVYKDFPSLLQSFLKTMNGVK